MSDEDAPRAVYQVDALPFFNPGQPEVRRLWAFVTRSVYGSSRTTIFDSAGNPATLPTDSQGDVIWGSNRLPCRVYWTEPEARAGLADAIRERIRQLQRRLEELEARAVVLERIADRLCGAGNGQLWQDMDGYQGPRWVMQKNVVTGERRLVPTIDAEGVRGER